MHTRHQHRLVATSPVGAVMRRTTRTAALAFVMLGSSMIGCRQGESTAPDAIEQFDGTLNTVAWSGAPTVFAVPGAGAADHLMLIGYRPDLRVIVHADFRGVGSYELTPENVTIQALVGGDLQTGGYVGRPVSPGTLTITHYGGIGGTIRAELDFTADYATGEQRLGPTAAFRGGRIQAVVHSIER